MHNAKVDFREVPQVLVLAVPGRYVDRFSVRSLLHYTFVDFDGLTVWPLPFSYLGLEVFIDNFVDIHACDCGLGHFVYGIHNLLAEWHSVFLNSFRLARVAGTNIIDKFSDKQLDIRFSVYLCIHYLV